VAPVDAHRRGDHVGALAVAGEVAGGEFSPVKGRRDRVSASATVVDCRARCERESRTGIKLKRFLNFQKSMNSAQI
jgi:hypothetical protein